MFNYGNFDWQIHYTAAQGYQDSNTSVVLDTSYSWLSYLLPIMKGNTGKNMKPDLETKGSRVTGHRVNDFGRVWSRINMSHPEFDPV